MQSALAAGARALDTVPADLAARRRELLAADSMAGASSATGIEHRLTVALAADAMVIGPRTTLWRGAAAVREGLRGDTANMHAMVRWSPIRGDVSADGSEGYTFGFLDISGGSSPRPAWKYLAYWRRDGSGRWQIIAHKRLPREPGAHEERAPEGFESPRNRTGSWFPGGISALQELMAWDSAFARSAQRGAAPAFLEFTAHDGATLTGRPNFAWGREKVAAEFAPFEPGTIDWAPDAGHVAPSADLGFATGEVIIREKQKDGTLTEAGRGRYLTIWKRQPDGTWKLIIDG